MSKIPKTVCKNPVRTLYINDNDTVLPEDKKCKSLMLPNRVFMHKDGKVYAFPVYRDTDVGIDT